MGSADSADVGSILCVSPVIIVGCHLPAPLLEEGPHLVLFRSVCLLVSHFDYKI